MAQWKVHTSDPAKQTVPGVSGQLACRRSDGVTRPRYSTEPDYSGAARLVKRFSAFFSIPWLLPEPLGRLAQRDRSAGASMSDAVKPRCPCSARSSAPRLRHSLALSLRGRGAQAVSLGGSTLYQAAAQAPAARGLPRVRLLVRGFTNSRLSRARSACVESTGLGRRAQSRSGALPRAGEALGARSRSIGESITCRGGEPSSCRRRSNGSRAPPKGS